MKDVEWSLGKFRAFRNTFTDLTRTKEATYKYKHGVGN